jgi:regulator of protease activity HflC (stomatin/prohibitin superfamily)
MERVPFFRRPTVLLVLGTLGAALLYLYIQGRVVDPAVPRLMLFTIPPLAFLCLTYLEYRSINILFIAGPGSRSLPAAALGFLTITSILLLNLLLFGDSEGAEKVFSLILDLDLLLLVFLFTLLLSAQFVLPVESIQERLAVADRLLGHVLGERGPVTYVRNGHAVQAHGEDRRRGPGVFLVDHASAIVLRTDTAFTRAAGPGVVFSQPGERLAEAVDLRRQERSLKAEDSGSQAKKGKLTGSSLAITRDGIPVSADLSITFMIDPGHRREPREGRDPEKPPYEFHAPSVERAVFGHVYGDYEDVGWNDLPLMLMADVWREEIKRWSMNELLADAVGEESIMAQITEHLQERLIPSPENPRTPSEENKPEIEAEILAARGVRPIELEIRNLRPPADVQRERLLQWHEAWYGEIQAALQESREEVERSRRLGEAEAALELLRQIPGRLDQALEAGEQPGRKQTLLLILQEARQLTSPDGPLPDANLLVPRLERMIEEVESLGDNCQKGGA